MLYSFVLLLLALIGVSIYVVESAGQQVFKSQLELRPSSLVKLDTSLGTLVGYAQDVQNKTINVFYSVPYAEPPVDTLRFKRSRLVDRFPQDPYEALEFKAHCPLLKVPSRFNGSDLFSDDCLYANIWTPNLDELKVDGVCKSKKNVMIYLVGSNSSIYQMYPFADGESRAHIAYDGRMFAALHDTIVVIFNYRQRLFATLYLDDGEYVGNLALFDQHLAISWVKKHIHEFCGDDERITTFGQSFGANFLSIQLLSGYSKNLIDNAILQSGFPLFQDQFPVTRNEQLINSYLALNGLNCLNFESEKLQESGELLDKQLKAKFFKEVGGKVVLRKKLFISKLRKNWFKTDTRLKARFGQLAQDDCVDPDSYIDEDVLRLLKWLVNRTVDYDCLQKASIEQIIALDPIHHNRGWQIMVDDDFLDQKTYLDYKLFNKLDVNPKLNLLIGGLSSEKYEFSLRNEYYTDKFNAPQIPKEDAKEWIRNYVSLFKDTPKLRNKLADLYTDETRWQLANGYFDAITAVKTEYLYTCAYHFFSKQTSMTANRVFNFIIDKVPTKHFAAYTDYDLNDYAWLGIGHADDLSYLFGHPHIVSNQFTDLDRKFSNDLLSLWVYFAKNGRMPTLDSGKEWPVQNKHHSQPRYVEISGRFLREFKFEFEERCDQFWLPLLNLYKR